MADDLYARLDELVDTDPLRLRDEAFALFRRAEEAEAERDALKAAARAALDRPHTRQTVQMLRTALDTPKEATDGG